MCADVVSFWEPRDHPPEIQPCFIEGISFGFGDHHEVSSRRRTQNYHQCENQLLSPPECHWSDCKCHCEWNRTVICGRRNFSSHWTLCKYGSLKWGCGIG